ncbi:MAG: exodeoxyribonuclease V subunit alpha, partial [Gammaproteobacteria bacterium]
ASEAVLWAGALVSHQLDRGEVALDLEKLCRQPGPTLAIPTDDAWRSEHEAAGRELALFRTYDPETWCAELLASKLVAPGAGNTPLVLDGRKLYLRRYWHYRQIADRGILRRLQPVRDDLPESFGKQAAALFGAAPEQPDWQKIACVLAMRARFAIITGGPGTGKTTTLAKLLALSIGLHRSENAADAPLNIFLAAPTGKAAARVSESIGKALAHLDVADAIKQSIPTQALTLHRLLGSRHDSRRFLHDRFNPLVADIVIVDEASMIDLEMMASLLEALPERCRLILLGDKDQLASVEAGSVMGDLCWGADRAAYDEAARAWIGRHAGATLAPPTDNGSALNQQTVMLRHSHRFGEHSGIGRLAQAVNAGNVAQVRSILDDVDAYPDLLPEFGEDYRQLRAGPNKDAAMRLLGRLVALNTGSAGPGQGYGCYLDVIRQRRPQGAEDYDAWAEQVLAAFDAFQVLCALRRGPWGVEGLNRFIEERLFPERTRGFWYEGRPVMITRNDYNLGLMNGDVGITLTDTDGKLKVVFPSGDPKTKIRWLSPMRLPDVETAFAITVHKSQGSEFAHVALVLPEYRSPVVTRELIYTGITRAKDRFTLLESAADVLYQAVATSCR